MPAGKRLSLKEDFEYHRAINAYKQYDETAAEEFVTEVAKLQNDIKNYPVPTNAKDTVQMLRLSAYDVLREYDRLYKCTDNSELKNRLAYGKEGAKFLEAMTTFMQKTAEANFNATNKEFTDAVTAINNFCINIDSRNRPEVERLKIAGIAMGCLAVVLAVIQMAVKYSGDEITATCAALIMVAVFLCVPACRKETAIANDLLTKKTFETDAAAPQKTLVANYNLAPGLNALLGQSDKAFKKAVKAEKAEEDEKSTAKPALN